MEDADDISVIEYIYQLNVSKLIKDNKHNNKELVTEVKKIIRRKEKRLEKIYASKGWWNNELWKLYLKWWGV